MRVSSFKILCLLFLPFRAWLVVIAARVATGTWLPTWVVLSALLVDIVLSVVDLTTLLVLTSCPRQAPLSQATVLGLWRLVAAKAILRDAEELRWSTSTNVPPTSESVSGSGSSTNPPSRPWTGNSLSPDSPTTVRKRSTSQRESPVDTSSEEVEEKQSPDATCSTKKPFDAYSALATL